MKKAMIGTGYRACLGALAFAIVMTAPASAQQTQQVVTQFDDATIARLLLDVQATWQTEAVQGARAIYRASAEGGIGFTLQPRACDEKQMCRSAMVVATFTRSDKRSLADLDAMLSAFNDRYASAKAYRANDGTVILQAYINAAGGTSFANARAQLLVFGQNIGLMRSALTAFGEGG